MDEIDKKHIDKKYTGIINCFYKTIRNDGFRALWRGYLPTMIRAIPVNGSIFLVYNHIKEILTEI